VRVPNQGPAVAGVALWAAALGLAGCATMPVADQLERDLRAGDYAAGLETVERSKDQYAGANSLLYYFDKGSLEQRVGDYAASNAALEQAEKLIEEVSVTSISEAAASMLVNDTTLAYSGEDFERVMVNVLKTLNYLYLGDLDGALVEARKVNTQLLKLSDQYGETAVYKQDAFARYLSAFAYESAGEYNDAYIDYKKAYTAYKIYQRQFGTPVPTVLAHDLLRLSRWLGFDDDHAEWREHFADVGESGEVPRRPVKRSELLVVAYDGRMLSKYTRYVAVPIRDPDGNPYVLKVAFPAFKLTPPGVEGVTLVLPDGTTLSAEVAQPLAEIAVKNLEQRIGLISLKAIARATAKYVAAYQVRKASGEGSFLGFAASLYTWISEQADLRSWRTLPFRFFLLRVSLPPGRHDLELMSDPYGGGGPRRFPLTVELAPGEKKVLPVYLDR
jgi:uncharacterized protein